MKEGYQTPWILQDRTTELFGCEHVLFLQDKKRMIPKWSRDHQSCLLIFKKDDHRLAFNRPGGLPQCAQRQTISQNGLLPSLEIS